MKPGTTSTMFLLVRFGLLARCSGVVSMRSTGLLLLLMTRQGPAWAV
jgi:hypothetical protein